MYLKRLTCQGFKSFADKTDFDFGPGVTAIVGPNGCGKSNIVDSIKWVLGDQSPRSLRGKQMLDVIFNGSGTRKSSGMAQVDLLFDNTDRKLPCDTDEVLITRRLYRSGESEYLLNNDAVRLKDIRELFMDTGIGIGAYSIIEQGKVDLLLQANPQERRVIFEEAAGISRYKARKREAQRKLERAEQNLLRLEDIIEEVEKRLRSIKYQAGKARNFQQYDQQLREKRATYSLAEYHRLRERQNELTGETAVLGDRATGLRTDISAAEAQSSTLDGELLKLEAEISQIEQQILTNASAITANRERIEQSRTRMAELANTRARAQQRLAVERQRATQILRQIETEEAANRSIEADIQSAGEMVKQLTEQDRDIARELARLQAQSEEAKANIIELLRRTAQLHNEIQSYRQREEQLETDKHRLHQRHQQIEADLAALLAERERVESRGRELADLLQNQSRIIEDKHRQAEELDASRAAINRQLAAAKEYRSGLLSRRQLLLDLDRQMEGVDAGVREVLHLREQDGTGQTFGYIVGMVADLIAVDVANARLIETALGEFDQYLVVEDSARFFADAERIADLPGRVRALCLDRLPPFIDGRDFSQQEGFVAYAMDLVRFEPDMERFVRQLLGKTIIVRTLADALRMAEQNPPSYRYVTQSGELLDPDGYCQLGPAGAGAGLISRKSELREIDQQIAEVDERIAETTDQLERTTADIEGLEREQHELRAAIYDTRAAQAENTAAYNNLETGIQRLRHEQPLLAGETESLQMQIDEARNRAAQSRESLSRLEEDSSAQERHARQLDEQIGALADRRRELTERITEARVAVGQLIQKRTMLADALRGLRASRQASDEAVQASAREADEARERITQAERAILAADSRLAELFLEKEGLSRNVLARQHRREQIRYEHEQLAGRIKSQRGQLTEVEEKLHELQMELQEARIRTEDLLGRVRDELNIDLAEVYLNYQHEDQDWAALEAEIEELKEKIRRLGNVNLDAIAEQEELEKRAEFLVTQRDDLRHSRRQLEELIDDLNKECRERFTTTFEAVRKHFQDMFRKLFGGGKGDIMLEQPPDGQPFDVLEAGIEIQARPPGKELQSISLMSGGEKTMTAIALVLAIFQSRPSPFAVLDEVDAALDEANNERFNRIVRDFLEHSQFLVITHSKRTMTIADVMYGVTMQEAGVSKRVSVRFDSTEEHTAAA